MKKKPPARAKRGKRVRKPVSAETRAADDVLRESLRNADMRILDKALAKAIRAPNAAR